MVFIGTPKDHCIGNAATMEPFIRILHITEMMLGGVASHLEEVLPYQAQKLGKENVLLLAPKQHTKYISPRITSPVEFYSRTGRNFLSLIRLWRAAQKCIEQYKPNVVQLHSSFAGGIVRLLLTPHRANPKVIYCPHGWAFTSTNVLALQHLYAAIERFLARKTDVIVNVSSAEANSAVSFGLPPSNQTVILNGISPLVPGVTTVIKFNPDTINLLFAGRHDRQKGLDLLIEAMAQLIDYPIHLHVLGESVLSRTSKTGHRLPNITIYGWVPRAEVSAYIDAADALIMPSRYEGFPFIALEAMRMSRPVIGSDCDGLTEIVVNGETGILFPANDAQAIVQTLKSIDHSRLTSMRRLAAQRFQENFTSDRMNKQLFNLYTAVISGGAYLDDKHFSSRTKQADPV